MKKPYFKKSHNAWFVNGRDGKPIKLGKTQDEAFEAWRNIPADNLKGDDKPEREPAPAVVHPAGKVKLLKKLVADYLEWVSRNREKATHTSYQRVLKSLEGLKDDEDNLIYDELGAEELRRFHLDQIVKQKSNQKLVIEERKRTKNRLLRVWSETTQWHFFKAVNAMMNWAEDQGIIDENPLGKMKDKPQCGVRQDWITEDEFNRLLAVCEEEQLTNVLVMLWETGARPFEILQVRAKHLDRQARCLRLSRAGGDKVKGKRGKKLIVRNIYLSQRAFDLCCKLADLIPEGLLFANTVGEPWTSGLISARIKVLKKRTGIGVKKDKRQITAYTFRHSFCTRAIQKGMNIRTIQELMGHSDLNMIAKIYAHLNNDQGHLTQALDSLLN